MKYRARAAAFAVLIVLGFGAGHAVAQDQGLPTAALAELEPRAALETGPENDQEAPDEFGVLSLGVRILPVWAMRPTQESFTSGYSGSGYFHRTGGDTYLCGALNDLPMGCRLKHVVIDYYDNTNAGGLHWELYRYWGDNGFELMHQRTVPHAGGYGHDWYEFPVSVPIDHFANDGTVYLLCVRFDAGVNDGGLRFRDFRVLFWRTVSPAPAQPTFNDVPSNHQFYQYVEALAESGITSGCGGGNYCPDQPLTRGQMAVFLAKALGLHWGVSTL